ncbi:MAG TPA: ATP-binding protein, partial [Planctomycetota bacterium]|nr:ATP-binding protein [Planctomycetota bacterium]
MANEPVITTKFTPGNPDPIFFAGQQEKIFKYYKILQNYLSQYPNIYGENIYILQGDTGLGKTTFLKHLQKYVQNNIAKLIPMYISCNDLLGTPERFLKIFWIEFENLVQSSEFQLNTINTFLQQTNWKEILLKISPRLSSFSFINTPLPFQSLCDILKKAYLDIENFSEMLQIMQWILQESGLFLFLMLDDFLIIQQNSKVEQTILSSLYQIQKANSVFFFLLTID